MTGWSRSQMAARAAADIADGSIVNLGIGMPELVADHLASGSDILFHSENGLLGMGPRPAPDAVDPELINAGKMPVTMLSGGAYFHHADSFAMIRGGHVDLCILGAYEVACNGDVANWSTGSDGVPAVGGAMDLVAGARQVWIMTAHCTKAGAPKLTTALTLAATGRGAVDRIYTDLAVLEPAGISFRLIDCAPGVTLEALRERTGAPITGG